MGVLNVTPDSFSDGGAHLDPERAIERGLELADQGADYIDVGGESTRPGAKPVEASVERSRIEPVVRGLARQTRVPISIDTTKASVAEAALEAGATMVNDVSAGLCDRDMLALVQSAGSGYVLMHMQGTPANMQANPEYADVVSDVIGFLRGRVEACLSAGIESARLWVDPGIGFGKTLDHNLTLLRRLRELKVLGLPILVGISRKSFIAKINARMGATQSPRAADQRLGGTAAAVSACVLAGADCLRVHDVAVMAEAARVAFALGEPERSG
jgi:dihydropteroate synthase